MNATDQTPAFPFAIGCPVWACDAWADIVYPRRTPRNQWLSWYSRMFNTVEGNSTFYALPNLETAKRWAKESAIGFHFALKFPRDISHEGKPKPSLLLNQFIEIISVLHDANRDGPSFLQLPPWFDDSRFDELLEFLEQLPSEFAWAVEPRHASWFDKSETETKLNEALASLGIDRVIFDSRALFQAKPDDEIEAVSQKRKPQSPIRFTRTGTRPMIRIVGRNRVELADEVVAQWLPILDAWVQEGCRPYVFTHAPDDAFAPAFCRRMATAYRTSEDRNAMPLPTIQAAAKQMTLFDDEAMER